MALIHLFLKLIWNTDGHMHMHLFTGPLPKGLHPPVWPGWSQQPRAQPAVLLSRDPGMWAATGCPSGCTWLAGTWVWCRESGRARCPNVGWLSVEIYSLVFLERSHSEFLPGSAFSEDFWKEFLPLGFCWLLAVSSVQLLPLPSRGFPCFNSVFVCVFLMTTPVL